MIALHQIVYPSKKNRRSLRKYLYICIGQWNDNKNAFDFEINMKMQCIWFYNENPLEILLYNKMHWKWN